jgi:hypothetical protein
MQLVLMFLVPRPSIFGRGYLAWFIVLDIGSLGGAAGRIVAAALVPFEHFPHLGAESHARRTLMSVAFTKDRSRTETMGTRQVTESLHRRILY